MIYGCLIVVRSVTHAQKVLKITASHGYGGRIIRSPYDIQIGGCGYAVAVEQRNLPEILVLLKEHGAPDYKVYVSFADGYRETGSKSGLS